MMDLIRIYWFRGWSPREIREFWTSLFLTILACAIAVSFAFILQ